MNMKRELIVGTLNLAFVTVASAATFVTGEKAKAWPAQLQAKADAMKAAVLSAKSDYAAATGTHYHVSADGDDARDRRTPATAIRSLSAATLRRPASSSCRRRNATCPAERAGRHDADRP